MHGDAAFDNLCRVITEIVPLSRLPLHSCLLLRTTSSANFAIFVLFVSCLSSFRVFVVQMSPDPNLITPTSRSITTSSFAIFVLSFRAFRSFRVFALQISRSLPSRFRASNVPLLQHHQHPPTVNRIAGLHRHGANMTRPRRVDV